MDGPTLVWTAGRLSGMRAHRRRLPARQGTYRLLTPQWDWLIAYGPRSGRVVVGVRPRGSLGVYDPYFPAERENMKKRVVQATETPGSGPVHLAAVETQVLAKFPRLIEHLVTTRYSDGGPRRPGMVMISVMGAMWQVRCTEPDSSARLTCWADNLDDALAMAELHLGVDDAPWEADPYGVGKKAKK